MKASGRALVVGRFVIGLAVLVVGGSVLGPGLLTSAGAGVGATATFADAPSGAAAGVTGGTGGPIVTVRTLDASGPGSLRAAVVGNEARIVVFAISGTIELDTAIEVGSNVTIDGRGSDITISGAGLLVSSSTNVIIRNLRIMDGPTDDPYADAIGVLAGSSGVWIDHVEVSNFPDGLVDVTQGSTDVTISWSYLHDHGKAMLLGDASRNGSEPVVDMTVHHTRFENTGERNPMMRQGNYSIVNNVLRDWGYDEDSGYGMRVDCGGRAWIEANEFDHGDNNDPIPHLDESQCGDRRINAWVVKDNRVRRQVGSVRAELVAEPQDIVVEPLTDELVASIDTHAGWQDVPNPYLQPDLYRVSSDKARIEWSSDPEASRYEWRVERCDGAVVVAEESGSNTKKISGLSPDCYQGFVRVLEPAVGAWEATPRLYLDVPEPDSDTDDACAPAASRQMC